jgi:hypothetical protein
VLSVLTQGLWMAACAYKEGCVAAGGGTDEGVGFARVSRLHLQQLHSVLRGAGRAGVTPLPACEGWGVRVVGVCVLVSLYEPI